MKINIHEYPEGASALTLARFQVAVMEAHEAGAKIEYRPKHKRVGWSFTSGPCWAWHSDDYRVIQNVSKLASGHNPDKLTEEQVGVKYGWRLLSTDELTYRVTLNEGLQYVIEKWRQEKWDDTGWAGSNPDATYRTKNPPGFYLPKPKTFKPWTFDTAPKGLVLIRVRGGVVKCWGVVQAWDEGLDLLVAFATSGPIALKFDALLNRYEHSVDGGKTWSRCGVEVSE